jgi:hypothetical protein
LGVEIEGLGWILVLKSGFWDGRLTTQAFDIYTHFFDAGLL